MKKQNCFFDFHVRMGDFVVYGLNGKLCMRQLPKRSKKLCKGMIVQQVRIKSVAILYRAMKDAGLLEAWRRAKKPLGWSAYNLFLQKNILVLKEDGCIGDFMSLLVTAGKVWCPKSMAACREEEAGVWRVKWLNDEQLITDDMGMAHCRRDDRLGAVLMRGDAKWFEMRPLEVEGGAREEGQAMVRVPEELRSWRYLYCFMESTDGDYSSSVCIDLTGCGDGMLEYVEHLKSRKEE